MATNARKFVYEIAAKYTGEPSLKKLQDELEQIDKIKLGDGLYDDLQKAASAMKEAEAEAARLKEALEKSFDPKIANKLDREIGKLGGFEADFAKQESALEGLGKRYAEAKRQRDEYMRGLSSTVSDEEADTLAQLNAELIRAELNWRKQGEAVQAAGEKMAASRSKVAELERALSQSRDPRLQRQYDEQTRALEQNRKTLDEVAGKYDEARKSMAEFGATAQNSAAKLKALQESTQKAGNIAGARRVLGIPDHKDIEAQIAQVRKAFSDLKQATDLKGLPLAQARVAMMSNIAELEAKTNGWATALGRAKGQILALAGTLHSLGKGLNLSIEFESNMADVRKTVGGTKAEIERLGLDLRKMALRIPVDPNDLARIAAIGGQLGMAKEEIVQFTDIVAKMGEAFDMSAEEAGNAIGKLKNVFQLDLTGVEGLGDAVNQLGNNMAAREREIIDVMLRIGGTSKQFGIANENAAALAATFLALGRPVNVAGTAINAMLNNLQTAKMQPKRFQEALAAIGMSAEEMAAKIQANPQKALNDLLTALSKLEGAQRAEVLTGLFGKEFQDDIGVLVGSLDTYQKALDLVADKTKYNGAMQDEYRQKVETAEATLKLFGNAARDIWRSIGDGLKIWVAGAADFLQPLIAKLAEIIQQMPELAAGIVGFASAFATWKTFKFIGANIALLFEGIKKSFLGLKSVQMAEELAGIGNSATGAASAFRRLADAAKAATGTGAALRVGIYGAAAVGVVNIGRLAKTIYEWRKAEQEKNASLERGKRLQEELAQKYEAISQATGVVIKSHQDLIKAIDEGKLHYDDATGKWVAGAKKRQEASKEVAQTVVKVEGEALKELVQEYKKHFDEIIRLQDDIAGRQKSLAAELRDMGRSGMSDKDAWADQKREAEEYVAAAKRAAEEAKRAMASGDTITGAAKWKEAVQYADDAKSAYRALNKEVKDGDKVVVSKAEALETAMAGVKEAGELGIDLLKQQQQEAYKVMDALEEKSGFAGLMSHMDEALNKWMEGWKAMQGVGEETVENVTFRITEQERQIEGLQSAWMRSWQNNRNYFVKVTDELQKRLDKATEPRTVKVYVAEVKKNRWGGLIEAARYQMGGPVQRLRQLARGGKLAGYGGGDRISALLEAGEFVVRKEAVRKFGAGFFHALNNLRLPELPDLSALLPQPAAALPGGGHMVLELKLPGGETVAATVSGDDAERLDRFNRRVSNTRFRR